MKSTDILDLTSTEQKRTKKPAITLFPSKTNLTTSANLTKTILFDTKIFLKNGFTMRLKRLKPRAPDFRGLQNFGSKENFRCFCKQLYLYFLFWFNARFFTIPLTKDLYRKMSVNDWSKWRWTFSFYGVENWLLLRIICGKKHLNKFFRLHEASEVFNKYVMGV